MGNAAAPWRSEAACSLGLSGSGGGSVAGEERQGLLSGLQARPRSPGKAGGGGEAVGEAVRASRRG